jgi:iron-sulfur cluster assembly accessory protein
MDFFEVVLNTEINFCRDGAKVVVDGVSLEMVRGAKVDFVEEMISSSFQIVENPKSDASCGCGASFSPKA